MSDNGEPSVHARKVFISHSNRDKELVDALINMLILGVGLHNEEYFCSDLPGSGVWLGQDILGRIRTELSGTALAIEVITPSYLESRWCNWELGGLWLAMKTNSPLLVPPATYKDLGGILRTMNVPYIEQGLDDLADAVAKAIGGRRTGSAAWSKAKSEFLQQWSSALRHKLEELGRALVPREEYEKVVRQRDAANVSLLAFDKLGKKYDYFLESLPELIQGINRVSRASHKKQRMAASELEYVTAYRAAHLYNRHGLRAVVWHARNGQISLGKFVGKWAEGQPGLDADRERRLIEGPIRHIQKVCVEDQAATEYAEYAMLGPRDKDYPSFLLAPILADRRNYGLLQLEASSGPPLDAEDFEVVRLMAAMLACGLSVVPTVSGADSIAGPAEGGD